MARIDKIKEEIVWLKVLFAISIATDISLPEDESYEGLRKALINKV